MPTMDALKASAVHGLISSTPSLKLGDQLMSALLTMILRRE